MEIVSQTPIARLTLPEGKTEAPPRTLVLPDLLRCLVLTWSQSRAELLRLAARNESWQTTVDVDVREFLRNLYLLRVPLTFVDLPDAKTKGYSVMREAALRTTELGNSLVVICGLAGNPAEEMWARQLGSWAYLPGDNGLAGLELVFGDARKAVANQALVCVELEAYR